jgi:hypothetical protein
VLLGWLNTLPVLGDWLCHMRAASLVIPVPSIPIPDLFGVAVPGQACPRSALGRGIVPPVILIVVVKTLMDIIRLCFK